MSQIADVTSDRPPGDRLRAVVVRIHAGLLFAITVVACTSATAGWQGSGPYRLLADQPWGFIGLYQAYLSMFIIAVVAWIGAVRWGGRLWNAVLLCAELVPTSIILIAWDELHTAETDQFANLGFAIHIPLILLETFALLWRGGARVARVRPR